MATRTGGELIVDTLIAFGVDTIFGIPGVHNLGIYEALRRKPQIRHILTRHEQGAAFMADGYARVSGKPGVALVTTGPGALNTLTPLGEAYTDSSPVLVIATNVERGLLETGRGTLHELKDQPGAFRAVIGQCERAMAAADLAPALQRTWAALEGPRPRPAALDVPHDVLVEETDVDVPCRPPCLRRAPAKDVVEKACTILQAAARPVIFAGGGVASAGGSAALTQLAERLGAPVVTTSKGKGVIPEDHPLALGYLGTGRSPVAGHVRNADVVLAVGTRLSGSTASLWQTPSRQKLVRIDADPRELQAGVTPTLAILADARLALEALVGALGAGKREPDVDALNAARRQVVDHAHQTAPWHCALLEAIRRAMPRDGVLCLDMTMPAYQSRVSYQTLAPRTLLGPAGFGTLGFAVPAAIGAKAAAGNRPVVALVGDGGFQYTMQEVATAIQHDLGVVFLVANDNCYTAVKRAQERQFGQTFAIDLVNPDFQCLAAAYGMPSELVPSTDALPDALTRAFARTGPTLLEITIPLA